MGLNEQIQRIDKYISYLDKRVEILGDKIEKIEESIAATLKGVKELIDKKEN